MRRKIIQAWLMPSRPHARPNGRRYELKLACGHITWRPAYDLMRGDKLPETLLCRTCTARLKAAGEGLRDV